jgi:crossover junction endodeoxyribonuclease RuvC
MLRILGIDPGSRYTGYGVISTDGRRSMHVVSGRICLDKHAFNDRLGEIYRNIDAIIAEFTPDEIAIEQVFMHKSPGSALKLGQARGAAIAAAVMRGYSVHEYAARLIKQAVVGTGAADKAQVSHMVRVLLNVQDTLSEDQSDALAIALCHAHSRPATAAQAQTVLRAAP